MTPSVAENLKQTESRFADDRERLFQRYRPGADPRLTIRSESADSSNPFGRATSEYAIDAKCRRFCASSPTRFSEHGVADRAKPGRRSCGGCARCLQIGRRRATRRRSRAGKSGVVIADQRADMPLVVQPAEELAEGNHHVFAVGWTLLQASVPCLHVRDGRTINLKLKIPIERRSCRNVRQGE
jgi:hypothetical protein